MFTRSVAPTLLLIAVAWAALGAQSATVSPGSRVRLRTITGPTVEGRVLTMSADSLVLLGEGGQISVPTTRVQSLETWRGRGSSWRTGAEIGWLAGFAATTAVYAARMRNCIGIACAKIVRWKVYAATGGLAGALVGGLVGAAFRHDCWERVPLGPLHPEMAIGASDQGIGLSIRF
jgi:hypothetical protein